MKTKLLCESGKRCILLLVSLAILVSLVPVQIAGANPPEAAGSSNANSPSSATTGYDSPPLVTGSALMPLSAVDVETWAELNVAVGTVGSPVTATIVLTDDIELPAGAPFNAITIPPGSDITLTGGHSITRTGGTQRHFIVNGTLTLENITISGSYPAGPANHGGIEVNAGGSLYMEDGSVITRNRQSAANQAAGVRVWGAGATFVMNGGAIENNQSPQGAGSGGAGGVFVENSAVFTMNGGVIRNNGGRLGGGVRLGTGAALPAFTETRMYMNGGEIYGNSGSLGGGINVERGTFTMESGTIRNNTASGLANSGGVLALNRGGGGVFMQNDGRFFMNGGTIHNNHSYQRGGGVHMLAGTVFTMSGGIISNNNAINNSTYDPSHNTGGGVAVQGGLFNMEGGTVTGNSAARDGGGIWVYNGTPTTGARLDMTGGTVSYNTATSGDGGGIFANPTGTADPLPANAYQNIISAIGTFYGNTAGGGKFAPPSNASTRNFGYYLNNYDINFRGPNRLVIFDLNGGNVGGDTNDIMISLPMNSVIGDANVPAPVRQHHDFNGWRYTGQTAGTLNYSSADVAALTVLGPITFTAQWTHRTHTVTFDLNGGTVNNSTTDIEHVRPEGSQVGAVNVPAPERANHSTSGWQLDGVGSVLSPGDVAAMDVYGDMRFVAVWEIHIHEVTFHLQGGTGNFPMQIVPHGNFAAEPLTEPTPGAGTGDFIGWFTHPLSTSYSPFDFATTPILSNTRIYARWESPLYTISINVVDIDGNQIPTATVDFGGANVARHVSGYWIVTFSAPTAGTATATAYGFVSDSANVLISDFSNRIAEATIVLLQPPPDNGCDGDKDNDCDDENGCDDNNKDNGCDDNGETEEPETPPVSQPAPTARPSVEQPVMPLPQPDEQFHERFMIGYPDGNFMPNGFITRAETAALLVRTMTTSFGVGVHRSADGINGKFSDVSSDAWYAEYLAIAYSYGLIQGFTDGSFRPDIPITREQFAAMLARTATIQTGGVLTYSDAANISGWAYDYVYTALAVGFMHGDAVGTFRPLYSITRAEAAAAINRILGRGDTTARSINGVANVIIFPDAADINAWHYFYVLEATNSHWFVRDGYEEIWTAVRIYP